MKRKVKKHFCFTLNQIKECMEFLSAYFFRLRVSNDDAVTFGLYPKWDQYVTHLAQLLSHLASSSILDADTTNRHQSGDAEQGMEQ